MFYPQLIRDMVSIGEATNWLPRRGAHAKYRALKTHIECLPHHSKEFKEIKAYITSSKTRCQNYTTTQFTAMQMKKYARLITFWHKFKCCKYYNCSALFIEELTLNAPIVTSVKFLFVILTQSVNAIRNHIRGCLHGKTRTGASFPM